MAVKSICSRFITGAMSVFVVPYIRSLKTLCVFVPPMVEGGLCAALGLKYYCCNCCVAAAAAGSTSTNTDEDDFFTRRRGGNTAPADAVDRLHQYLQMASTSDNTVCIATWPELKEFFIKLNTPLPARAAAERLLRRTAMMDDDDDDELFENLILMKKYNDFKPL